MLADGIDDAQFLGRLQLEAQALARLRHRNLVEVSGFDTTPDGRPFIVMEYLRGQTLHERLNQVGGGPLPLSETISIVTQVCAGLEVIHKAGLVHRDMKPSNIFLCEDGTAKVLDLGLAKVVGDGTVTPSPLAIPTVTGVILGTPRYMAPEQIAGENIEARTDQYALGCILYRCLTGRGPFDAARGWDEVLAAHVIGQPVTPSSHLTEPLPPALDGIVMRCLEKKPEARYASAAVLAQELEGIVEDLEATGIFDRGYITQPMLPPTVMMEPALRADPSQPIILPLPPGGGPTDPSGGVSLKAFVWLLTAAVLVGAVLGGLIVSGGVF